MVQATVSEPLALLVAFVAHYLELGADLVHLYLDTPQPEAEAAFKDHPRVRVTRCDAAYWARVAPKGRPVVVPQRQMINARHCFRQMTQDWILLCDADEYLSPSRPVADILASQGAGMDYLRIPVAEKVLPPDMQPQTLFEGLFRTGQVEDPSPAPEIYGPDLAPMLGRIVAGHDDGKSFLRRGLQCRFRIHRPLPLERKSQSDPTPPKLRSRWMQDAHLAHFDALTPLFYLIKILNWQSVRNKQDALGLPIGQRHPTRDLQLAFVLAACAQGNPVQITQALHRLTPQSMEALRDRGLLLDLPLTPDQTARRHFPDLVLDFTPAAFDRALMQKHAQLLAEMGVTTALPHP